MVQMSLLGTTYDFDHDPNSLTDLFIKPWAMSEDQRKHDNASSSGGGGERKKTKETGAELRSETLEAISTRTRGKG